jgi:hypothetical protein
MVHRSFFSGSDQMDDRQVVPTCRDTLLRVQALIVYLVMVVFVASARGQIQQAWVARYNNGIANGTNQAVKMALDAAGNIYVTGFSQNSLSNLGYVTIKYAPNGNPVWTTRYDSTNDTSATPTALALDSSNDVFVTGNASTVKYDPNGNQLWTAPYAGTALAVDTNGNCIVTGISTSFGTVKLNPNGSNVWMATYPTSYSPGAVGEQVLTAPDSSIYVAGYYTYGRQGAFYQQQLLVIKYGSNGSQIWTTNYTPSSIGIVQLQNTAAAIDSANNLYLVANFSPPGEPTYIPLKYDSIGTGGWVGESPDVHCGPNDAYGLALDKAGNVFVTGQACYLYDNNYYDTVSFGTYKANTNGSWVWTNQFPPVGPFSASAGLAIAVDSGSNCYVTGYSPGTNSNNDIVTIKYDPNGNQVWLQRYNGPGNGNDAGNAIAVDNNGNVYVTGYDTTTAGGTEMVTIKYSPVTLQRRADGTVLLQAQGSPGESFDIQASSNLENWLDLGSVTANSNGLMQFTDTNTPNYNARFYVTSPQ